MSIASDTWPRPSAAGGNEGAGPDNRRFHTRFHTRRRQSGDSRRCRRRMQLEIEARLVRSETGQGLAGGAPPSDHVVNPFRAAHHPLTIHPTVRPSSTHSPPPEAAICAHGSWRLSNPALVGLWMDELPRWLLLMRHGVLSLPLPLPSLTVLPSLHRSHLPHPSMWSFTDARLHGKLDIPGRLPGVQRACRTHRPCLQTPPHSPPPSSVPTSV
jgi:hypothetical protein